MAYFARRASVVEEARYSGLVHASDRHACATVDASGDYLALEDSWDLKGGVARLYRITPGGKVTEIALTGSRVHGCVNIIPDGASGFLFVDPGTSGVFRLSPTGTVTNFSEPWDMFEETGLARDPKTGEVAVVVCHVTQMFRFGPDGSFLSREGESVGTYPTGVLVEPAR